MLLPTRKSRLLVLATVLALGPLGATPALAGSPPTVTHQASAAVHRALSEHGLVEAGSVTTLVPKLLTSTRGRRVDVSCEVTVVVATWATATSSSRQAIARSNARVVRFGRSAKTATAARAECVTTAAAKLAVARVIPFLRDAS